MRRAKGLFLLFLLGELLLVQRACQPAPTHATCFQVLTKPPRDYWRGFHGPAYLPYPLPRKPRQAWLDSLARVMRFRKL